MFEAISSVSIFKFIFSHIFVMGAILDFPQEKDGISICQNIRLKLLMCVLSVTKALNGNMLLLPIWLCIQWKRSTYAKNVDFLPLMLQHLSFTKEITTVS